MYLGIDIGGMSIKCGLVDDNGMILAKKSIPTHLGDYKVTISEIAELCFDTAKLGGVSFEDIIGIGTGVPGTVHNGVVTFAANLNWYGVPYVEELEKLTGKKCFAANDANCALLGEFTFGAAKGLNDVMLVTLGTGVGTAFITQGKLLLGNRSAGTEGGHIKIKDHGVQCGCGRKDCWEVYAATTSLLKRTQAIIESNPEGITAKIVERDGLSGFAIFEGEKEGDKQASAVLDEYIQDIVVGLVNYANIFRPEKIIIGGGISAQKRIISPIEDLVNAEAYGGTNNPHISISAATFLNDAGIIGAAALAKQG